jgi:hypothetical protein
MSPRCIKPILLFCLGFFVISADAQVYLADNGLTASGTGTNKVVSIGGTLNNLPTAIDFGNSNTSSNFLFKKGTSNYFFIDNNGNIAIGHNTPAQKLDVSGMIKSTSGFTYGGLYGGTWDIYGTSTRYMTNANTDAIDFLTMKIPSSIKFRVNNGGRGIILDGATADFIFMDGSGNSLGGIGSANGTGHMTLLYSTAINTHTEGARLTNTGNFLIGTTTDAGHKLQVAGNAYINGNLGIGITAAASNFHVVQSSASQSAAIIKSFSDAQTANTFEVQDAAGTAVLKVRGTDGGTYGQSIVTINAGNKTNNPALTINNIGVGVAGLAFGGNDGGSVNLHEFDFLHSPTWTYTNKHAKWRVINNAFDGLSAESYSFEHLDQPATMTLMTLKGQASQTGDMFRIKNSGGTDIFRIKAAGGGYFADNVGIGVTTPSAQLHTSGSVRFQGLTNDNTQIRVVVSDVNGNLSYRDASSLGGGGSVSGSANFIAKYATTTSIGNSLLYDNGTNVGVGTATPNTNAKLDVNGNIFSSGKIAIGTTDIAKISTYSLAVNGDALFNKIKIKAYANWPDYVFQSNYRLAALNEIELFIQQHKHLPGVPAAEEIEKNGFDVGDNQALLLKKIEELTLYIIDQDKRIKRLEEQLKK